jgi:hypothetical protein
MGFILQDVAVWQVILVPALRAQTLGQVHTPRAAVDEAQAMRLIVIVTGDIILPTAVASIEAHVNHAQNVTRVNIFQGVTAFMPVHARHVQLVQPATIPLDAVD